jgi:hypothetical protein
MLKRVSRTSLLVAKAAVISGRPTAEEQLAATAAGERCMMQSVLNAVFLPRYPLNPKTTDQSTAVIAIKPEGNPQARIPCTFKEIGQKPRKFRGFFIPFLLPLNIFFFYLLSFVRKLQFLCQ